eukprot:CFRG6346T1
MVIDDIAKSTIRPSPLTQPRYMGVYKFPLFKLSVLDIAAQNTADDRSVVLFFNGDPVDPKKLENAISITLGVFPILAGRLERDDSGNLCININDAGVPLIIEHKHPSTAEYETNHNGIHGICATKVVDYVDRVGKINQDHPDPNQPLCLFKITKFKAVRYYGNTEGRPETKRTIVRTDTTETDSCVNIPTTLSTSTQAQSSTTATTNKRTPIPTPLPYHAMADVDKDSIPTFDLDKPTHIRVPTPPMYISSSSSVQSKQKPFTRSAASKSVVGTVATGNLDCMDSATGDNDSGSQDYKPDPPTCALGVSVSACIADMDSLHQLITCLMAHYNDAEYVPLKSLDRCKPFYELNAPSTSNDFNLMSPPKGYHCEHRGFMNSFIKNYMTPVLSTAVFRLPVSHRVRALVLEGKSFNTAMASYLWNVFTDLKDAVRNANKTPRELTAHAPLSSKSSSFATRHATMNLHLPVSLRHSDLLPLDYFGNAELQTIVELPTDSLVSASQFSIDDVTNAIELQLATNQQRAAVKAGLKWLNGALVMDKRIMIDQRAAVGISYLNMNVSERDWYAFEFGTSGRPAFVNVPPTRHSWYALVLKANRNEVDIHVTLPKSAMDVMLLEWSDHLNLLQRTLVTS